MSLRDHFPIFEDKIYINSCSHGALLHEVQQAYQDYLTDRDRYGSHWEHWVGKLETFRAMLARLLNASSNEIAVTASASASVNSVASALDFEGPRRKIIVSDFEFPTVGQIWHAQVRRGAEIVHVADTGTSIPLQRFEELIDDRTLLVSIAQVCYRNGAKLDVPAITELAHSRGALVMLDSYQALGTEPIDVSALGVDFLVGGTLKYLLGSAGVALLYVRRDLIEQLTPTVSGWFAQNDINAMDIYANDPSPTARRFEMGTPPVPNIYASLAGIELIESIGLQQISAEIGALTAAIKQGAAERGFKLATPVDPDAHGAMIAIKTLHEAALVNALAAAGIVTSSRDGNVRVSPHFYNTREDIETLLQTLERHRSLLC